MGLMKKHLQIINQSLVRVFGDAIVGKKMMELGDQCMLPEAGWEIDVQTGKEYFAAMGFEHISVDLNAEHGALPYDLSLPVLRDDWIGAFDVLTNFGTSEHVEPFNAQYECFRTMHQWVRVGGIFIHFVPDIEALERDGAWKDHCRYYYSSTFFTMLARENGYSIINVEFIDGLVAITLCKEKDCRFMGDRSLFLKHIARRSTGYCYPRINDHRALWKRRAAMIRQVFFAR